MAEEEVSDDNAAQIDRCDGFRQSRVALVNVGVVHGGSSAAGLLIAPGAALLRLFVLPDQTAEISPLAGVGNNLVEIFIEDGNADAGNGIEILQQRG